MDNFDQWQEYWDKFLLNRHGKEEVQTEEDLYLQVARTVERRPIEKSVFDKIIEKIIADLALSPNDILVDFCCGNGLFTYELKDKVRRIIGVDFSQSIIDTANKFKAADNIEYRCGNAIDYLSGFRQEWPGVVPNKYLMNDALAYFTPGDLEQMLTYMKEVSPKFVFVSRGVPNEDLKWNYYNTDERKAFYKSLQEKGDLTNAGLGSWWNPAEIEAVCGKLGLNCTIVNQELPISDYRMDIIIKRTA